MLSTDPPVDRRDGDVAPERFDRRDTHLRGDARRLETATSEIPHCESSLARRARSHSAVICGENDRDARFVTAECDKRAAIAARADSSIESCRGKRLSRRTATAEATEGFEDAGRLGAELPAADIKLAAADEIENEHLRCGSSTQYPRSSERQSMNANIGTTLFTRNRCARRSFDS